MNNLMRKTYPVLFLTKQDVPEWVKNECNKITDYDEDLGDYVVCIKWSDIQVFAINTSSCFYIVSRNTWYDDDADVTKVKY